jgi:hypothetical protein
VDTFDPFASAETDDLVDELTSTVRDAIAELQTSGASWDAIGAALSGAPAAGVSLKGGGSWRGTLWISVKAEFHSFLCTDSASYSDLRKEWQNHRQQSISLAVAALSGVIGAHLGVASGVIAPLVIWAALVTARIGKQAFCSAFAPLPAENKNDPNSPVA